MATWLLRLLSDESGMEEVEIGIVASLLVLIGALIFIQIGNDSNILLVSLQAATNAVANQAGS
jgi:Flp pilus assembly pilin Flp